LVNDKHVYNISGQYRLFSMSIILIDIIILIDMGLMSSKSIILLDIDLLSSMSIILLDIKGFTEATTL